MRRERGGRGFELGYFLGRGREGDDVFCSCRHATARKCAYEGVRRWLPVRIVPAGPVLSDFSYSTHLSQSLHGFTSYLHRPSSCSIVHLSSMLYNAQLVSRDLITRQLTVPLENMVFNTKVLEPFTTAYSLLIEAPSPQCIYSRHRYVYHTRRHNAVNKKQGTQKSLPKIMVYFQPLWTF